MNRLTKISAAAASLAVAFAALPANAGAVLDRVMANGKLVMDLRGVIFASHADVYAKDCKMKW